MPKRLNTGRKMESPVGRRRVSSSRHLGGQGAAGFSHHSAGCALEQGAGFAVHDAADEKGVLSDGISGLHHCLTARCLDFQDASVPSSFDIGGKGIVFHRRMTAPFPHLDVDGAALQVDSKPSQIGQRLQRRQLQGGNVQFFEVATFPYPEGFQDLPNRGFRHLLVALDIDDPDPAG